MGINLHSLKNELNKNVDERIDIENISPLSGGDICNTYKIQCRIKAYFLKTHRPSMLNMLQCEAENLQALAATKTLRVPLPITLGQTNQYSFLLLEYLELINSGSHASLGTSLAQLHQHKSNYFGWQQDNWIGVTPQPNDKQNDWLSFWRTSRLGHQFNLAKGNRAPHSLLVNCERLLCDFAVLFHGYAPNPSLLHGDLWAGNFGFITDGSPVIYDPACYYGDRETDLAMTELFGGFSTDFYNAYHEHWPLDSGYRARKDFYNLYHVLNHFNLFGGGYATQAEHLCLHILAEIN